MKKAILLVILLLGTMPFNACYDEPQADDGGMKKFYDTKFGKGHYGKDRFN